MSDGWAVACRLQATFTCSLGQSWGFFKPSGLEHSKDHGQTFQKQLSLSGHRENKLQASPAPFSERAHEAAQDRLVRGIPALFLS